MREPGSDAPVRRGIQTRLAVLVLVAALGPMALLGWSSLTSLAVMRNALLVEREALVKSASRQVEHGARAMLEALAAVPVGPSDSAWMRAAQHDALRLAQLRSRLLVGAMVVDRNGRVIASGVEQDPAFRSEIESCVAIREAIRTGKPTVCNPSEGGSGRRRFAVVPLRGATGTTTAAAVGVLDLQDRAWAALVPSMPVGASARLQLLDDRGGVLAGSPVRESAASDVVVSERLTVLPWTLVLAQPAKEMFAAVSMLERRWLILAPSLAGIAAVFAWGVSRSVKRPLAKLDEAAARIAAGDLTRPLPPLGRDEIGRLGRSFEAMRLALARDETRRRLLRKVITAQEEERKRIARELHDETCQTITALKMKLDAAGMDDAQAMATRSLDELHRIIYDLRPSILDDLGLLPAIRWMAERNLAPHGTKVRCEFEELSVRLPFEVEIAVYRAVQEAVNNVVRHAQAEQALIEVSVTGGVLEIDIEDDGVGFALSELGGPDAGGRGLGILGMHERMELIGGSAKVTSSPGGGTRVSLRVPIPDGGLA
jgi:signal transduction histidine kinase